MLNKNTNYILLYATLWIILFNLIISNKLLHLMILPLIIFGNYLLITRYHYLTSFYKISFTHLLLINILFHILLPIYIIRKNNLTYQFNISDGKKNIMRHFLPTLLLLAIYVLIIPIDKIYFINKTKFLYIVILLYTICCFFLKNSK